MKTLVGKRFEEQKSNLLGLNDIDLNEIKKKQIEQKTVKWIFNQQGKKKRLQDKPIYDETKCEQDAYNLRFNTKY